VSARDAPGGRAPRPVRPSAAITVDHPSIDQAQSPGKSRWAIGLPPAAIRSSDVCSKGGQLYGPKHPISNSRADPPGPAISSAPRRRGRVATGSSATSEPGTV
jgi:hypothetical protein